MNEYDSEGVRWDYGMSEYLVNASRVMWLDIFDIDTLDDDSVNVTYWDRKFGMWLTVNSDLPSIRYIVNSPENYGV